tara:strand:+ start:638 stop:838 length:201 start_codon:yes stop_codon:yes gene_type:complete
MREGILTSELFYTFTILEIKISLFDDNFFFFLLANPIFLPIDEQFDDDDRGHLLLPSPLLPDASLD